MSEDRSLSLHRARLRALVGEYAGAPEVSLIESTTLPMAVVGDDCWVALTQPRAGLGAALAVATSAALRAAVPSGVRQLHVVVDPSVSGEGAAEACARDAALFALPVRVSSIVGRTLVAATPATAPSEIPPVAEHLAFTPVIGAAGATPVVEHGVVSGEVFGLEVCRVVDDAQTGQARLEVGVGAHDREIFQMLHGDRPTAEALADVVAYVAAHRRPGAPAHPLGVLAPERALRQRVIAEPQLIGAQVVAAVAPPVARRNVKDSEPCSALATIDGELVTVTCAVGPDVEVVPRAALARAMHGTTRGLIAVPERDQLGALGRVSELLAVPIPVVGVPAVAFRS